MLDWQSFLPLYLRPSAGMQGLRTILYEYDNAEA